MSLIFQMDFKFTRLNVTQISEITSTCDIEAKLQSKVSKILCSIFIFSTWLWSKLIPLNSINDIHASMLMIFVLAYNCIYMYMF